MKKLLFSIAICSLFACTNDLIERENVSPDPVVQAQDFKMKDTVWKTLEIDPKKPATYFVSEPNSRYLTFLTATTVECRLTDFKGVELYKKTLTYAYDTQTSMITVNFDTGPRIGRVYQHDIIFKSVISGGDTFYAKQN